MKDVEVLRNAGANIEKSLELLGDMDMYNDVIKDFLNLVDEKVNNLNKYKSINDMSNYAIEVHSLKSDVRYLGFMDLGNLAYELELDSKNNDLASVSSKHDNLIREVNKVVKACKIYSYGTAEDEEVENTKIEFNYDVNALDPMSEAIIYQGNTIKSNVDLNKPKNGTILIVDDSQIVANFIRKVFESDYDVVTCEDGKKAIDYCMDPDNRSKIKACLLDLNMPNVNGFEVLENFKENNYFVKLPVVVISGVEDRVFIDKAKTYPILDVLLKPFNERDVVDIVNKCLAIYF